ncbi:hypothetical protein Tco_1386585 [Tanacetum coccineum]
MDSFDTIGTPLATSSKLDADLHGIPVDSQKYHRLLDADHAGFLDIRKSASGGTQLLSEKLTDYQLADLFTEAFPKESIECVSIYDGMEDEEEILKKSFATSTKLRRGKIKRWKMLKSKV